MNTEEYAWDIAMEKGSDSSMVDEYIRDGEDPPAQLQFRFLYGR